MMLGHWKAVIIVISLCLDPLFAGPFLQLTNRGDGELTVAIERAVLGHRFKLNLVRPGWRGNYDALVKLAAAETQPDANGVRATIGDFGGYTVSINPISQNHIALKYAVDLTRKLPLGAAYVSIFIPAEFAVQRGQIRMDGAPPVPFPLSRTTRPFYSGTTRKLTWTDGLGRSLELTLSDAARFHLEDYRAWGKPWFDLRIFIPTLSNPGQTNFTIALQTDAEAPPIRPLVDQFGQHSILDWPGKVRAPADLQADAEAEQKMPVPAPPAAWDAFGGWQGTRAKYNLPATGFFTTRKVNNRWWLIDPAGNLFFSLGTFFTYCDTYTDPAGREYLFEWLPAADSAHKSLWMKMHSNLCISFYKANLIKKYGPDWTRCWYENACLRWKAWAFNTTSAFGGRLRDVPFANGPYRVMDDCVTVLPGAAADVFEPDVAAKLDACCKRQFVRLRDNPLFLGYFFGNEQPFEKVPVVVPGLSGKFAAKRRLVQFLQDRYGDIEDFKRAWVISVSAFADLVDLKLPVTTPAAKADMDDFFALYCDTYGKLLRQAVRKHDPNHLLLGFRWMPSTARNKTLVENLGRHMDVISINYYTQAGINSQYLAQASRWAGDKPILLSEFSFGSRDRGHTGGVINVDNQTERGRHYRDYVETAAACPAVVGCHWYQYVDQAVTGRYFGGPKAERCNTGLVDITDRPYREFVDVVAQTNANIYPVAAGTVKPFALLRDRKLEKTVE